MLRSLINSQMVISRAFDRMLPKDFLTDGKQDYLQTMVPTYLGTSLVIYDIGGGKNPYLSVEKKQAIGATVVGLDIDAKELAQAPAGAYDGTICADISNYFGPPAADLVICQSLLEHVRNVPGAFESMARLLKPGGVAVLFVPSRNALFARLNLLLPQGVKQRLLFAVFPHMRRDHGFESYYHRCTPSDFKRMATANDLQVIEERYYFMSTYFSFFSPLYMLWRVWILSYRALAGNQAAETFALALKKRP